MDNFQAKLSRATAPDSREMLGAIGVVVDKEGGSIFNGITQQITVAKVLQEAFSTILHQAVNL